VVRSVVALFALSGAPGGCKGDAAPAAAADSEAPLGTTGFLAAPKCAECLADNCSAALRDCDADADCHALRRCEAACGDAACDDACVAAHPSKDGSGAVMDTLRLCAETQCGDPCPGRPATPAGVKACTDAFDGALAGLSTSCGAARDCGCANCAREWSSCLADPDCASSLECALTCRTPRSCSTDCGSADLFVTARLCSEKRCGGACGDAGAP
jgi:hypothetical protein